MLKSAASKPGSGLIAHCEALCEEDGVCSPEKLNAITNIFNEPIPKMESRPYPHVSIENVFDDAFLRNCLEELKTCLTGNFKETDLFKVYQTMDLAN